MMAHQLIQRASLEPDEIRTMEHAFDQAWTQIADHFGNDPVDIQKAQLRLAEAIVSVAGCDGRGVDALKNAALQALALAYRSPRKPNA
jgi:hypothetical protein